jgi:hypothetical protein
LLVLFLLFLLASANNVVAQGVPAIDFGPSCRLSAAGKVGLVQTEDNCRKSEEAARDLLIKEWGTFAAGDRIACYRLTTTGTPGTYTELLTCLEMKRDARLLTEPPKPPANRN